MIGKVLRNFNLFDDGLGYAGKVEEINPPKLTLKTDEFRAGGMDAPVELDMGMEKIEADFTLGGYEKEVIAQFGLAPGNEKQFTARGALQDEAGTVETCVINMTGKVKAVERGAWKGGDKSTLKIALALSYYKETIGGTVVHEIDIPNMKRVVNGTDQIAAIRSAIGM